jgi:hypothetical protein
VKTELTQAQIDDYRENGCLYFVPGTLRKAIYESAGIGEKLGDLFNLYPEWAKNPTVAAPMTAGSCSLHNGLHESMRIKERNA